MCLTLLKTFRLQQGKELQNHLNHNVEENKLKSFHSLTSHYGKASWKKERENKDEKKTKEKLL